MGVDVKLGDFDLQPSRFVSSERLCMTSAVLVSNEAATVWGIVIAGVALLVGCLWTKRRHWVMMKENLELCCQIQCRVVDTAIRDFAEAASTTIYSPNPDSGL